MQAILALVLVTFVFPIHRVLVSGFNVLTYPTQHRRCKAMDSHAIRLNANKASFQQLNQDQARGLGSGVEWALTDGFCGDLIKSKSFREHSLTCDTIIQSIERAMNIWSDRHPSVYFTHVSNPSRAELVFDAYDSTMKTTSDDTLGYHRISILSTPSEILGTVKGMKRKSILTANSIAINSNHCWFRRSRRECFDADDEAKFIVNMIEGGFVFAFIVMSWLMGTRRTEAFNRRKALESSLCSAEKQRDKDIAEITSLNAHNNIDRLFALKTQIPDIVLDGDLRVNSDESEVHWTHFKENAKKEGLSRSFLLDLIILIISVNGEASNEELMQYLHEHYDVVEIAAARRRSSFAREGNESEHAEVWALREWIDRQIEAEEQRSNERKESLGKSKSYNEMKVQEKSFDVMKAKEAEQSLGRKHAAVHWIVIPTFTTLFITYHFIVCPFSLFGRGCTNFETVVAHEIGHALGIGHHDDPIFLEKITKGSPKDRSGFIPVNDTDLCKGLTVKILDSACSDIHDYRECVSNPYCQLDERYDLLAVRDPKKIACTTIFSKTLMASHLGRDEVVDKLSQDDLAALYFLYPSKRRSASWGLDPIPLRDWDVAKLRAIASTELGGAEAVAQCRSDDLVVCILIHRLSKVVEKFDLFKQKCSVEKPDFCSSLARLGEVMHEGLTFAQNSVVDDTSDDNVAKAMYERLKSARVETEIAGSRHIAQDEKFQLDEYIEAFTHSLFDGDHDANEDGVHDHDSDTDALPDEIEKGLDALLEVLRELGAGGLGHSESASSGDSGTSKRELMFDKVFDKYDKMTVKKLRIAIKEAGLEKEARGFMEKEEFVKLLVDWEISK